MGGLGLAWLKTRADRDLAAPNYWGGEMAFVLLLTGTGLTGLILYAATGTAAVPALLALHLGTVLAFFLLMPYSKMIHGFYRVAALIRDAQIKATVGGRTATHPQDERRGGWSSGDLTQGARMVAGPATDDSILNSWVPYAIPNGSIQHEPP